jgi:Tfp pilus assembly protein PilO
MKILEIIRGFFEENEDKLDYIRKYQKYIYIFIIIITWAQLFFIMVQPKIQMHKARKQKLIDFQKIFQTKKSKTINKATVEKELQNLQEKIAQKEKMVFEAAEFNAFYISKLTKIAESKGTEVSNVVLNKETDKGKGVKEVNINLTITGDFFSILELIKKLENYSKVINVVSFSLSRKTINPVILNCRLNIETYINK